MLLIDSGHVDARIKFGDMRLAAGDLDEAVKEYTVAVHSPFAPLGCRITLGGLMIARARSTDNAAEWNNVAQYVNKLCEKYKNAVDPILLAAEMHMARQQYDLAKKLLRREAGKKVNDARIWSVLASIYQEADGLIAALDVLDEAQALLGDNVELRLARARAWATDWQPGREDRIRALGQGIEDLADAEQIRLLNGLSEVCSSIGDLEGTEQFQLQLATLAVRDVQVRRTIVALASRLRDEPLREKMLAEMRPLTDETFVAVTDALSLLYWADASDPRLVEWA